VTHAIPGKPLSDAARMQPADHGCAAAEPEDELEPLRRAPPQGGSGPGPGLRRLGAAAPGGHAGQEGGALPGPSACLAGRPASGRGHAQRRTGLADRERGDGGDRARLGALGHPAAGCQALAVPHAV